MKKLAAILLAVLFVFSASACNKMPVSSPSVSVPTTSFIENESSSKNNLSSEVSSLESSSNKTSSEEYSDTSSEESAPPPPQPIDHSSHYCYSVLNDIQKQYYNSLHKAVEELHNSWVVLGPLTDSYISDVSIVRQALVSDHPDIFWLPPYHVTAAGSDSEGNPAALVMFSSSADVSPSYIVNRSEKDYMEQELNTAIALIASQITSSDPFEIELQLHDLLCQKVTYSADSSDPLIYTAYGALVNGKALCEGYSRAMQLLLLHFNIPCTTVSGIAEGAGHMWNAVNIGGNWHHLDATWNDTSSGFISHEYFNLSDDEILIDHAFSKEFSSLTAEEFALGTIPFNVNRPSCPTANSNYFNKKGFVFGADNLAALVAYIASSPDEVIEVKFADQAFKAEFEASADAILQEIALQLSLTYNANYYIGRYSVSATALKLYKVAY